MSRLLKRFKYDTLSFNVILRFQSPSFDQQPLGHFNLQHFLFLFFSRLITWTPSIFESFARLPPLLRKQAFLIPQPSAYASFMLILSLAYEAIVHWLRRERSNLVLRFLRELSGKCSLSVSMVFSLVVVHEGHIYALIKTGHCMEQFSLKLKTN